nr:MAG TPA: hypothetical protein [Caudoviricetes sp.]
MKTYGITSKFRYNYKDNHPRRRKGEANWWEVELGEIIKGRERRKNKLRKFDIINENIKDFS